MTSPYTQDTRIGSFTTPLGKDTLVLRSFQGKEAMSDLFEFRVQALATERGLDFDKAIGRNCTVSLKTLEGGTRHFDGMLTEVQLLSEVDEGLVYGLVLRPWLWLLSKSRIFHEKTPPQIIAEIFGKHGGLARYEQLLSREYPALEYAVQYRESDMDFVRRLMENHGISFHFRHGEGQHSLVMGDGARAYKPIPGERRPFIALEKYHQRETEHLFRWAPERKFTSGRFTLKDYDFERPTADMLAEKSGDSRYAHGKFEVFDYPGSYVHKPVGEDYAKWRLDRELSTDGRFAAEGDCISCAPGTLVTLSGHPDNSQNRKYLALSCTHTFFSEAYRSQRKIMEEEAYKGSYEFLEADRAYAPEAVTPRPYLRGPQTAIVVGEGEIDCDEYGRVKVRFHWDRNHDDSMRVRVAQVWASDKWGGMFIPRVGMEVIVDFLEGDPDHPIIVGCVYNGQNMPPYDLPGEKNTSGWKSDSTPGGGGYNEIAMDDTAGSELLRVHAQKDMDVTVENDENRTVGRNRSTSIGADDSHNVGRDLYIEAGSSITLKVGSSTIVIDGTSITMKSATISGHAMAHLETKSDMSATHTASGPLVIKGAIVNIN
jgi:type VI secretion system secreted protein VgrG